MNAKDGTWIALLVLGATAIWLRDRRWTADAGDVLPSLAGFPLMVWLGAPWRLDSSGSPGLHGPSLALAGVAVAVGIATDLTLVLAIAWTLALWSWLGPRLEPSRRRRIRRLLVLPFAAFPWIALDLQPLGWWFRLSAAQVTEFLFGGVGFDVTREGTHLLVQGMPVEVSAACAGMNALQSMLIAGAFLAYVLLGDSPLYVRNIVLLLPLAWIANTGRVVALTATAVTWGQEFASGAFHEWGGLLVLTTMFFACWAVFRWQQLLGQARLP